MAPGGGNPEILGYIKSHWPERERRHQAERSASDGG
jgi:hypothetical protein